MVAGYPDGRLAVYDLGDRQPLAQRLPMTPPAAGGPAVDQANAIRRDGEVVAWYEQATDRIRLQQRDGTALPDVPADGAWIEAMALSDDGTRLVTVADRQ